MIRSLALAVAAVMALAAAPAMAAAPAAPVAKETKIDPKNHEQGQKEVPAVVAAAGLPCTVTDGYFVADTTQKDDKGAPVKAKIYEATCKEGMGYIYIAPATGPTKRYDCVTINESPSNLGCRLPGYTDNKAIVASLVSATGRTCTVSGVRSVGSTPAGDSFYEVGCSDKLGFILKRAASGQLSTNECAQAIGGNLECKLTTKAQIDAATNALMADLVAKSGKTCTVSGSRTIGGDASGSTFYEIACGPTAGFVAVTDKSGAFTRAVDCAKASSIAGGCTLTNTAVAETAEAATYTKLAGASGFPCTVSKYRFIGTDPKTNSEVVELVCSNRTDGGIAVLPTDNSPGHVFDCVRAGTLGQACKLSDPALVYPKYTAALAAKGKSTCTVSNARWIGRSADHNTDLVETACTDGLPGWVVELGQNNQVVDLLNCGQAKAAGLQCTLPGNTK